MLLSLTLVIIFNIALFLCNDFIAKLFNIYDYPDKVRKFHKKPVPITGGLFLYLNTVLYFIIQILFFEKNLFFENIDYIYIFLFFCTIFFLLGFVDDKYDINSNLKFILTLIFTTSILFLDQTLIISNVKFSFINFDLNIF